MRSNLSFSKILFTSLAVLIFFVLPCAAISEYQKTGNLPFLSSLQNSGRVAGISTENSNVVNVGSITLNLNSQEGILVIAGIFLVGLSIILVLFLLIENTRGKKKFKY